MRKFHIGFNTRIESEPERETVVSACKPAVVPRRSVVKVYFPHREMSWSYYNDLFDLQVGDLVYVEGKLEGFRGQVTEVSYSFKIKPSDYKRVISVVDTEVTGELYFVGSHVVSFDRNAIPFSKVVTWFKAPENDEEYIIGDDEGERFPIDDLSMMKISRDAADRGHEYYAENRVSYIELDGTHGRAIVEGSQNYEVEFDYSEGEVSNIKCSCFCSGVCKHEFAVMLQLRESLGLVTENYEDKYNRYLALVGKGAFMSTVMSRKTSGKVTFEV